MTSFGELSAEEQARQLRDPEGETGMATADALAAINHAGNLYLIGSLGLVPGDKVLEVGCGLAAMAADVTAAADNIEYAGLDRDLTVIGAGDRAEIWATDAWEAYYASSEADFADNEEEVIPGIF